MAARCVLSVLALCCAAFWAERDKKNLENLASPQDIFHVMVPFQQSSAILGYIEGFRAYGNLKGCLSVVSWSLIHLLMQEKLSFWYAANKVISLIIFLLWTCYTMQLKYTNLQIQHKRSQWTVIKKLYILMQIHRKKPNPTILFTSPPLKSRVGHEWKEMRVQTARKISQRKCFCIPLTYGAGRTFSRYDYWKQISSFICHCEPEVRSS